MLLATTVEALQADCGRLSELTDDGTLQPAAGDRRRHGRAGAAPSRRSARCSDGALAIGVGHSHVLAVARAARPFYAVERDLLEHLAAQAAVSLENLRLEELMRRTEAELRAILEGVADAVAAEDPDGPAGLRQRRRRAAAGRRGRARHAARDPGRPAARPARAQGRARRAAGRPPPRRAALVAREGQPGARGRRRRLAISVIEDITEIKQAEEAQRFLAESSRALVALARGRGDAARGRAARGRVHMADACVIDARRGRGRAAPGTPGSRGAVESQRSPIPRARRHRGHDHAARRPRRRALAEDLGAAGRRGGRQRAPVPHARGDRADAPALAAAAGAARDPRAARPPRCSGRPARATRSAATSTTSSRPASASGSRSWATSAARAPRRPR